MPYKVLTYTTTAVHALLTMYFVVSAWLVFVGNFYEKHMLSHIVWTVALIATFVIQKLYKGCPLTFLEKQLLEKDDKKKATSYGISFTVYWVHKLTGIRLPLQAVNAIMYIYLLLVLLSWLQQMIRS